ncbi:hypothetical protein IVB69_02205 [Flavobacterium sp. J49]|uniref:hypothetical protein n=1 Tax=Flavobacterium sp. J49 TaxID=2718534 RepID=UPI001594C4EA|nr:hypothetical protein [Flavobacterium sp. J49]MBF6640285.1 hypothetical protein [Flavobacterium sp. J49]NIC01530.1 hypothetical protein [Flavobacterium sp. J49]
MNKLLIILLGVLFFNCNSKAQNDSAKSQTEKPKLNGKQIVTELEKLNFFNLTAKEDLNESKTEFQKSYDELSFFEGKMRGESLIFTDNRFYFIDCETLFEGEGLTQYLETVKITFEKLNLKLMYSDEISNQAENRWVHKIKLNGKPYVAYEGVFNDNDWGIAFVNFIEMLNDQLKLQKSNERFYPISSGNDGRMVLLTKEQFEFVMANYPNGKDSPKEINAWRKGYGL